MISNGFQFGNLTKFENTEKIKIGIELTPVQGSAESNIVVVSVAFGVIAQAKVSVLSFYHCCLRRPTAGLTGCKVKFQEIEGT